jgi:hypothetical protein
LPQHAFGCLDAFYRDATLGRQIELHLVEIHEPAIDIPQMYARLTRKSVEIGANRVQIPGLACGIDGASRGLALELILRPAHRPIGNVKLADASR